MMIKMVKLKDKKWKKQPRYEFRAKDKNGKTVSLFYDSMEEAQKHNPHLMDFVFVGYSPWYNYKARYGIEQ